MSVHAYDAAEQTGFTLADAEDAVGSRATLHLTGEITEAGESSSGPYVRFTFDARWGFPSGTSLVLDLDALELSS